MTLYASYKTHLDSGGAVVGTVVRLSGVVALLRDGSRLTEVEANLGGVDLVVSEEQEEAESRLGEDIEDTVEDGLRVGVDDVATLRQTPGNGVEEPEEDGQDTTLEEGRLDRSTKSVGVAATVNNEFVDDKEEGEHAKDPVTPLVRSLGESTNETSHDHDLIGQNSDSNGRPWDASGKEKIREKQWCGDEPINVPNVEDLASASAAHNSASDELSLDGHLAQIRSHGPVGNAGNSRDSSSNVVEKTVRLGLGHGHTHESEGGGTHHRADGEVPVRRVDGDLEVGMSANHPVDVNSLVSGHLVVVFVYK